MLKRCLPIPLISGYHCNNLHNSLHKNLQNNLHKNLHNNLHPICNSINGTSLTSNPQTSDASKVGQCKRRTYKSRTGRSFGLEPMSDWDKRRASTSTGLYIDKENIGLRLMLNGPKIY